MTKGRKLSLPALPSFSCKGVAFNMLLILSVWDLFQCFPNRPQMAALSWHLSAARDSGVMVMNCEHTLL